MERELAEILDVLPLFAGATMGLLFIFAGYLAIVIDRGRADSPSRDDTQAGLKLVLYALALVGLALAVFGATRLLATILGGFHDFVGTLKATVPAIGVGAGVVAVIAVALLPRTNSSTARQVERFAVGFVTFQYGLVAIFGIYSAMHDLFTSVAWVDTSRGLAHGLVGGVVAFLAVARFGSASGWTMPPPRVVLPPPSYPPPPPPTGAPPPPPADASGGGSPYAPR